MQTAQRAIRRLALIGWLGLVGGMDGPAPRAQAAAPPERILPDSTIFLLKLNDAKNLREAFRGSSYGQLWNDPAMKEFRDDLSQKVEEWAKPLQEKIGVSLKQLLELPQGSVAVAAMSRDDPKLPVAVALLADAGENKSKMAEVLGRSTKQAEDAGAKVSQESFQGLTLHVLQWPAAKNKDQDKEKKDQEKETPPPPVVWTQAEGLFFLGSDVDVIKDLTAHQQGRENSLAANESFAKTQAKTDSAKAQIVWFLDLAKLIKLVLKASAKGNEGQAQQNEVLVQELGINGLKSVGGCFTLGAGGYDSLSKTFFLAPKPVQGILKIFSFPPIALRPESWVPAGVASYQSFSWDLDNAFNAINDIVNKFQPGMLNILQQQLVGPNGGPPLDFQQDVFGPLGDRVTLISDFKKPIKEDSQRMLLAVALEDAKAFQNTVNRIFEIAQAAPQKREFQGTTIYDVAMPNLPNPGGGPQAALKGTVSFAIAKDTFFVTTDTTLLEQVLRPVSAALGENASFQTVTKEIPERVSGMSFVRPDESARLLYDLVKSGQYEKAIRQATGAAAGAQRQQLPQLGKVLANEKLPEFSVIAKYLSVGGSYSIMDDDGFTMTGFTLRRSGP
ncbi:MAG TPA: hypothetical protein VFF52_06715 [Isosphaeraceae bacterium]|nr:hypothetical protein [Isosphaeraceae bacterium]